MTGADLKPFALLAALSEDERETVADLLERMALDPDEQLFLEGQESDGLVLVAEGQLRLSSNRVGDLGVLGPGDSLGAVGLVVPGARELTAVASEESEVWLLSRESFQRLLLDDARCGCRILEAAVADFAQAVRLGLDRFAGG